MQTNHFAAYYRVDSAVSLSLHIVCLWLPFSVKPRLPAWPLVRTREVDDVAAGFESWQRSLSAKCGPPRWKILQWLCSTAVTGPMVASVD